MPGTKIAAAPNGIGTVELNDGAVTTPKLANAPNGVTTAKINDLQVTQAKIAVGATSLAPVNGGTDTPTGINFLAETVVAEVVQPAVSRGGIIQILVGVNGIASNGLGTTDVVTQLTVKLRMDGTPATADGTVLATSIEKISIKGTVVGAGYIVPFCFSIPFLEAGASAGVAHRFKLTAIADNSNISWTAQGMRMTVIEWA